MRPTTSLSTRKRIDKVPQDLADLIVKFVKGWESFGKDVAEKKEKRK